MFVTFAIYISFACFVNLFIVWKWFWIKPKYCHSISLSPRCWLKYWVLQDVLRSYFHTLRIVSNNWFGVYLGVKTCDFFLCFLPLLSCTLLFQYLLFSLFYVTRELAGFYTEDEPINPWRTEQTSDARSTLGTRVKSKPNRREGQNWQVDKIDHALVKLFGKEGQCSV